MNKRAWLSWVFISIISFQATAQKKQFTIAEATNGMSTTLAPESVKNPSWEPGSWFWYTGKWEGKDAWISRSFVRDNSHPYFTVDLDGETRQINEVPPMKWLKQGESWFQIGKDIYFNDVQPKTISAKKTFTLPENADHVTVDKSKKVAYTIDNNLWMWAKEKGMVAVTNETNKGVVCGQSVHRDEFGIDHGIFFSPGGNYLAYYRMDQSMVRDYPIVKWDTTPAIADFIKYPMAGGTSHEVTLCVYDPANGKTVTMQTGTTNKDHYLTCMTWSPDEKYIYIAILNRAQNHLWLNKYSAATGEKVQTLFEEKSNKYVHPTHPLYFMRGNDHEFVWWSERDGYEHLYLYNTNGKLVRQLTHGKWVVNEIAGYNHDHHELIITAAKESPLEKHIYTVNVENGKMKRVDEGAGMHSATCDDDGLYVYDVFNGPGVPRKTMIWSPSDKSYTECLKNAPDPLSAYDRPTIKNVTITAADGETPLYGKLILPTHFDKNKKYPVIVYLYNGPNVQLIHNSFPESGNLWYEYMAQHGYVVFTMDGRGSWNRGLDFEQATFHHLGDVEMADQMKGVNYLRSLPYVDTNRMGVHGWSFGGFMTTSLMLKHPGVFKCAVAGGPVMDWKMYEVMYTERYMGTPANNPVGYENANLLDKVKNLKGKLLLIHGTQDNVVVWQHSIDFLKKCVDEGVQVDYFVYPGYEHNVRGKDRVHLMQKISDYFDEYLKPQS